MKPAPESILIRSRNQGRVKIQETIDDFFLKTIHECMARDPSKEMFYFQIKDANHICSGIGSDDRTTYLHYKEEISLAAVIEARTPFNRITYTFFRNI